MCAFLAMQMRLRRNARLNLFLFGWFLMAGTSVLAQTVPSGFTLAPFATGIGLPTAMTFAPDGRLFVCQQGGSLRVIKNGVLLADPFVSLTVDASGERGLLGVAFDPDFATNNFVYVYYTTRETPRRNRVSRFTANGDVAVSGSELVIMNLDSLSGATNHNGGAIHFGLDGKLYVAVGDNASSANAQTLNNRHGKVLRINKDGTIPTDNPFYSQTTGANRAIWTLGLRNPFTFAIHPVTGRIFINDVGQNTYEEINEGAPGANYGWSATEGYFDLDAFPAYQNPVYAYAQNGDPGGCAIAGGAFYVTTEPHFPASYAEKYFFADLCGNWVRYLDPDSSAVSAPFASGLSAPVDLQVGPDGALYVLQRGGGGIVYRISYAAAVSGTLTLEDCPPAVSPVTLTFRPASGDAFTRTLLTSADGTFTVRGVPAGSYQVAIRSPKFLQRVVSVDTTGGDVSGLAVTLLGGDANNDNSVDVLDLDALIQGFDATPNAPNWNNGVADFNCDDSVDVFDLDLLIRNFDAAGDS